MSRLQKPKISANPNAYGVGDYVKSLQSYCYKTILRASLATQKRRNIASFHFPNVKVPPLTCPDWKPLLSLPNVLL